MLILRKKLLPEPTLVTIRSCYAFFLLHTQETIFRPTPMIGLFGLRWSNECCPPLTRTWRVGKHLNLGWAVGEKQLGCSSQVPRLSLFHSNAVIQPSKFLRHWHVESVPKTYQVFNWAGPNRHGHGLRKRSLAEAKCGKQRGKQLFDNTTVALAGHGVTESPAASDR